MSEQQRVLFMGTGDIAIPSFEALVASPFQLIGLVTQPDKPVGRKQIMTPPAIKVIAEEKGIPVMQPAKARSKSFIDTVESLEPDLIIVMAYGQILTSRLIAAPKVAILNIHASLLPLYRGASCIQGPIADGREETGVSIIHVVKELDAGDVVTQHSFPLSPSDTANVVHDKISLLSPDALLEGIEKVLQDSTAGEPQIAEDFTYAPKLLRNDGLLDFSKTSVELERLVRAYHSWPGTYLLYKDKKGSEKRLKVFPPVEIEDEPSHALSVPCGDNKYLKITHVQPEGKSKMLVDQFLKGGFQSLV